MSPEWLEREWVIKPFRKKGCDFSIWHKDPKYKEAFCKIRGAWREKTVLAHVGLDTAAHPEVSGRPLGMFIDASDHAWAAALTQRPEAHAAPKIIRIVAKVLADVQQR